MDRQTIIATNRSLRNIKNELELLLEKGILSDHTFDQISALLPAESSVSSTTHSGAPSPALPVRNKAPSAFPAPEPVNEKAAPPAYSQTGPPALPVRNGPPPAAPTKPVLAMARALFTYKGDDARDVSFEKDDQIAIHEYMNADWWMGKNLRTGDEGIFPKNYVEVDEGEKSGTGTSAGGPSAPLNPYNSHTPPMSIANSGGERDGLGKANDQGKKFGKKLGNAAIFGAGATLGGKIVNGIF